MAVAAEIPMSIAASDWRPMPIRLALCYRVQPSRKERPALDRLASKPLLDPAGCHRTDPTTGKKVYVLINEIFGKEEPERFPKSGSRDRRQAYRYFAVTDKRWSTQPDEAQSRR